VRLLKRFTCTLCGHVCCSFSDEVEMPLVFPWEKRELLKIRGDLSFKPYMVFEISREKYAVVLYRWIIRGRCPFLSSTGKCSIHESKPLSCRVFPLLVGIDDNTLRVSLACAVIAQNPESYRGDPRVVFPSEYPQAIKAYLLIKVLEELAAVNGWVKKYIRNGLTGFFVDVDEVFEVEGIIRDVEARLAKYVQEHA